MWILGVQREANEVKRTLSNIPASTAKPTASALAVLELGQFYACWGKHVVKTYAQPVWVDDELAQRVAWGEPGRVCPDEPEGRVQGRRLRHDSHEAR